MAEEKKKKKDQVDPIRNLILTGVYTTEALINILARKGIITREEILDEIRAMKSEAETKGGRKK